jgi:hypothetical protein
MRASGRAQHDILALDVADEVDRQLGEEPVGLDDQRVALAALLPDAEQAHAGLADAQHALGVVGAHQGEVGQVLRLAGGVGAHVEDQAVAAGIGHDRAERWSLHAFDPLEHGDRRGHHRPAVAGRHEAVGQAIGDALQADDHRGPPLAHGQRWRLGHADDLGRVDDRQRQVAGAVAG